MFWIALPWILVGVLGLLAIFYKLRAWSWDYLLYKPLEPKGFGLRITGELEDLKGKYWDGTGRNIRYEVPGNIPRFELVLRGVYPKIQPGIEITPYPVLELLIPYTVTFQDGEAGHPDLKNAVIRWQQEATSSVRVKVMTASGNLYIVIVWAPVSLQG